LLSFAPSRMWRVTRAANLVSEMRCVATMRHVSGARGAET
jgi:chloramphenicol O-acetyltransferase